MSTSHDGINGSLSPKVGDLLSRANVELQNRRFGSAIQLLKAAYPYAPQSSAVLKPLAFALHMDGRHADAANIFRLLTDMAPMDPAAYNNYGSVLGAAGYFQDSVRALERACELAPERADYWFNLSKALQAAGSAPQACSALDRSLVIRPEDTKARLARADLLTILGDIPRAEEDLRFLLRLQPQSAAAWVRLVNLRTIILGPRDLESLKQALNWSGQTVDNRVSLGFALGQSLESAGRYEEAFAVFETANAAKRKSLHWDPSELRKSVADTIATFSQTIRQASDPALGREVVLIFGMPRSGSTLLEQVLSSHSKIEGAGEIGDLSIVIRQESQRRASPLSVWAPHATAEDWARLGREYLHRTEQWRGEKPIFSDKELGKWTLLGAARAMLPSARLVHASRDPLETCWSCYKIEFERDLQYSYDLTHLSEYWREHDRLMRFWKSRYPGKIFDHVHEQFTANPERHARALLAFCGQEFEPACLAPHQSRREIRTASAGQVRQPVAHRARITDRYGHLLDDLRGRLGLESNTSSKPTL